MQLRQRSSAECCTSYGKPATSLGGPAAPPCGHIAGPRRVVGWAGRERTEARGQPTASYSYAAQTYSDSQPAPSRPRLQTATEQPVLPNFWKDSQELGDRQQEGNSETELSPLAKTNLDLLLVMPGLLSQPVVCKASSSCGLCILPHWSPEERAYPIQCCTCQTEHRTAVSCLLSRKLRNYLLHLCLL